MPPGEPRVIKSQDFYLSDVETSVSSERYHSFHFGDYSCETDQSDEPVHNKWFQDGGSGCSSNSLPLVMTTGSCLNKDFRDWEKSSFRGLRVANSYTCGAVIGRGSFGTIRIGESSAKNGSVSKVAIKLEKLNHYGSSPCLDKEFKLLRRLQKGASGIPTLMALTTLGQYRALVMQLLGPNLQDLFDRCGKTFSPHCVALIALQLLDRFEYLHSEQVLYRDVKGENFLIGFPGTRQQNTIHVVDFGLAREWSKNQFEKRSPAGTPRYMSLRTHMGKQPSFRDDLESLSFLFIYFVKGKLPWQGIHDGSTTGRIKRIGIKKGSVSPEDLCNELNPGFCRLLKSARGLSYEQQPNYSIFRGIVNKILQEEEDSLGDGPKASFDWIDKNVSLEFGFEQKNDKVQNGGGKEIVSTGTEPAQNVKKESAAKSTKTGEDRGPGRPEAASRKSVVFETISAQSAEVLKATPTQESASKKTWGCFAFFKNLMISEKTEI